jgi:hypothetical protein
MDTCIQNIATHDYQTPSLLHLDIFLLKTQNYFRKANHSTDITLHII